MKQDRNANELHEWDLDGPWTEHLRREDQDLMDRIVRGSEGGHYFMLLGPKVCFHAADG